MKNRRIFRYLRIFHVSDNEELISKTKSFIDFDGEIERRSLPDSTTAANLSV
jgi:hypothetical protein